jgi:hypothetical protein
MSLRIGAGFRLGRHVWIGASVPLGHGLRLAKHQGHGSATWRSGRSIDWHEDRLARLGAR